jgi:hypothetical protein
MTPTEEKIMNAGAIGIGVVYGVAIMFFVFIGFENAPVGRETTMQAYHRGLMGNIASVVLTVTLTLSAVVVGAWLNFWYIKTVVDAQLRREHLELEKQQAEHLLKNPQEQMALVTPPNGSGSVFVTWQALRDDTDYKTVTAALGALLSVQPGATREELERILAPRLGITFTEVIRSPLPPPKDERSRKERALAERISELRTTMTAGAAFAEIRSEIEKDTALSDDERRLRLDLVQSVWERTITDL